MLAHRKIFRLHIGIFVPEILIQTSRITGRCRRLRTGILPKLIITRYIRIRNRCNHDIISVCILYIFSFAVLLLDLCHIRRGLVIVPRKPDCTIFKIIRIHLIFIPRITCIHSGLISGTCNFIRKGLNDRGLFCL